MRQHIIVPFDNSDSAREALRVAIEMAQKYKEKILLLNVQSKFTTPHTKVFFNDSDMRDYQQALYEEAITSGVRLLEESGIEFETKLLIGFAQDEIFKEAEHQQIRCIVMGSRGHSAFVGSVLGSVSQGVLYRANCPVMVVPSKQK
ncbi:universal stress protein [Paenibacillus monticola]|uniref:Universal stress protein n=1 Tax=Paenibacillus monticola TaxID=2666075 RepID=A0A7X2H273_9BACL|nr:universal stress protein [Paenibacillus monticola]MRN52182.1 universal stress protein [Paenibacillus monticola]